MINESLVLNYEHFITLNENGILEKIFFEKMCYHIRFFRNEIIHLRNNDDSQLCIYCYSSKKIKQNIVILANFLDSNDEELNEILTFIEKNEITLKIIDYENFCKEKIKNLDFTLISALVSKKENCILTDDEILPFESFYQAMEKNVLTKNITSKCLECNKKIENSSLGLKKCFECYIKNSGNSNSLSISTNNSSSLSNGSDGLKPLLLTKKRNPYNFIEKLQLNKKEFNLKKNLLDYSFQSENDISEYSI